MKSDCQHSLGSCREPDVGRSRPLSGLGLNETGPAQVAADRGPRNLDPVVVQGANGWSPVLRRDHQRSVWRRRRRIASTTDSDKALGLVLGRRDRASKAASPSSP